MLNEYRELTLLNLKQDDRLVSDEQLTWSSDEITLKKHNKYTYLCNSIACKCKELEINITSDKEFITSRIIYDGEKITQEDFKEYRYGNSISDFSNWFIRHLNGTNEITNITENKNGTEINIKFRTIINAYSDASSLCITMSSLMCSYLLDSTWFDSSFEDVIMAISLYDKDIKQYYKITDKTIEIVRRL